MKTYKILSIAVLLFLALVLVGGKAHAIEYFIDPVSGDDTYDGRAATYADGHGPWKTLNKAFGIMGVSQTKRAGYDSWYTAADPCTIWLMDGTHIPRPGYTGEGILVRGSYLTVKAYPGAKPKIVVPIAPTSQERKMVVLRIFGWAGAPPNHHITIDGIDLQGGYDYALKVDEECANITVRNCKIHDTGISCAKIVGGGTSVWPSNENFLMEYCEVYNSGFDPSEGCHNGQGINIENTKDAIIRNNYIHDISGGGGVYPKGYDVNLTLQNNFLYNNGLCSETPSKAVDNYGSIGLGDEMDAGYVPTGDKFEVAGITVTGNVIAESHGFAIRIRGTRDAVIRKNTIFNSARKDYGVDWKNAGVFTFYPGASGRLDKNIEIRENVVIDNLKPGYSLRQSIMEINGGSWVSGYTTATTLTLDDNLYFRENGDYRWQDGTRSIATNSFATWQSQSGKDANSIIPSSGANIIAILDNPNLPPDNVSSYARGSAVAANMGADVSSMNVGPQGQNLGPSAPGRVKVIEVKP